MQDIFSFVYLHSVDLEGASRSSCNLNVIFCPLAHGGLYASFGARNIQVIILCSEIMLGTFNF